MPSHTTMDHASSYFNEHWQKYQESVKHNLLYHREMFSTLNTFLKTHFSSRPFSLVDVGCGDCSSILQVLLDKPLKKYTGIDAAADVLKLAADTLAPLHCEKKLICEDMLQGIQLLNSPADIIFTSYAVHHLSPQQKIDFLNMCKNKLNKNGFLVMIDGVLDPNQTREEWLDALEQRFKVTDPDLSPEELHFRMQHPRRDDHPQSINAFETIAKENQWQQFQVLLKKGIFAFMVFAK